MNLRNMVLLAITCAIQVSLAAASDDNLAPLEEPTYTTTNPSQDSAKDPFGGVVVDQTVTGFGRTFFKNFVALWRDQPLNERYSISIHEGATARFGSRVWIEYSQRRIFQAFLPPSNTAIRVTSEKAVALVYSNIINADVERLLFRDVDIGPDEL